MPCHTATTKKDIVIPPDMTVERALQHLRKQKVSTLAVIDEEGRMVGLFSEKILLQNLIPVSVAVSEGVMMDIKVGAAPGVAKRLGKTKALPVCDVALRKFSSVDPDAPLWEAVSLITRHGGPLAVVDKNGKYFGLITYATLLDALEDMSGQE